MTGTDRFFAFFAAKAVAKGENIRDWNVDQLLNYHIIRLQQDYWEKIAGYTQYKEKINLLLVVNTLLSKLDDDDRHTALQYLQLNWQDIKDVYPKMTNVKEEYGVKYYLGLEPDILGEYFIITTLTKLAKEDKNEKEQADKLVQFTLINNPQSFFRTLYRIWEDFYRNVDFAIKNYPFETIVEKFLENNDEENLKNETANYFGAKGYHYGTAKKYEDALQCYSRAIIYVPNYTLWWNNTGVTKDNLGLYEDAIKDFDKALDIDQNNAVAYYNRGCAKAHLGLYEDAINDYNKALYIDQNHARAYNNRGNVKANLGLYEDALKDYNKALEIDQNYFSVYYNRGTTKAEHGLYEEAIEDFDKALHIDQNNADAYYNRGNAKAILGLYEDAINDYGKALDIDQNYVKSYYNRGNVKANLGLYEDAIKDFDKALNVDHNYTKAYNSRGMAKANLGLYKEAINDYDKALIINEHYADAYCNRGNTKASLGLYEEALKDFDKALDIDQNEARAWNDKSVTLIQLSYAGEEDEIHKKLLREALFCIQKALQNNGGNLYVLAWLYVLQNDKANTFIHLKNALEQQHVNFNYIEAHDIWNNYRQEPEYLALKEKYGEK